MLSQGRMIIRPCGRGDALDRRLLVPPSFSASLDGSSEPCCCAEVSSPALRLRGMRSGVILIWTATPSEPSEWSSVGSSSWNRRSPINRVAASQFALEVTIVDGVRSAVTSADGMPEPPFTTKEPDACLKRKNGRKNVNQHHIGQL